jgi:hypothetical protein
MHIELQPDKRYYSIGEIAKAFDVNASRFGTVDLILKPKKTLRKQDVYPEDIKNLNLFII